MDEFDSDAKVVYIGEEGEARAIRGIVFEDGSWLVVRRRNGDVRIPLSRVVSVREVRPP
jgi:uncharacterized protein (UPF0248 family)